MKKIYIAPKSISIEVETGGLMDITSIGMLCDDEFKTVDLPGAYNTKPKGDDSTNNFMGRKRDNSIWGED